MTMWRGREAVTRGRGSASVAVFIRFTREVGRWLEVGSCSGGPVARHGRLASLDGRRRRARFQPLRQDAHAGACVNRQENERAPQQHAPVASFYGEGDAGTRYGG